MGSHGRIDPDEKARRVGNGGRQIILPQASILCNCAAVHLILHLFKHPVLLKNLWPSIAHPRAGIIVFRE